MARLRLWVLAVFVGLPVLGQEQFADPDFQTTVQKPAYRRDGPTVEIDEAHSNFHTAGGRYKPFADLLKSDGYNVVSGTRKFAKSSFTGVNVLVISNALGVDRNSPAFTDAECDAVRDWVRDGGSLLLIADHTPFGTAAYNLAIRFGVAMGKGWAYDRDPKGGITTQLTFSRENGLLGVHPIVRGRDSSEEVKSIRSFTGQSLSVPEGATVLMKLSATAGESDDQAVLEREDTIARGKQVSGARATSAAGRAQGLTMTFGKGRVVMLGEAAMLSAQVARMTENGKQLEMKMGMNVPGHDDRQFALNVLHWLSRVLN